LNLRQVEIARACAQQGIQRLLAMTAIR
jgi:hypothetical protein